MSLRTVQRIWHAHRLQPHRVRTFKRSTDPRFAAKLDDVVGLYMAPPRHAAMLSIDEKSQIQALDRTQPGLPLKPGKCATFTHDYVFRRAEIAARRLRAVKSVPQSSKASAIALPDDALDGLMDSAWWRGPEP